MTHKRFEFLIIFSSNKIALYRYIAHYCSQKLIVIDVLFMGIYLYTRKTHYHSPCGVVYTCMYGVSYRASSNPAYYSQQLRLYTELFLFPIHLTPFQSTSPHSNNNCREHSCTVRRRMSIINGRNKQMITGGRKRLRVW